MILDGSFENTTGSSNPNVKVGGRPNPGIGGGWSTFSTYLYSTLYTMPGPINSGIQYLRPYPSGTYGITQSSQVVTQLYLDNNLVGPLLIQEEAETNTVVQFSAGLLPPLSTHTYAIIFSDTGNPPVTQTNQFQFTVADYLTLPSSLSTPLGSEDATQAWLQCACLANRFPT